MSFPANAELFAEQLQTMVETGFDNYGQLVKISESDAEKLRGLVEGTTTVNYSLPTVSDILSEDAAQYFADGIKKLRLLELQRQRTLAQGTLTQYSRQEIYLSAEEVQALLKRITELDAKMQRLKRAD